MWTKSSEGRKLIQEISKDIIVEIAPEEMDLFDDLVTEYFQNPAPPDYSASPKDDPLGFGIGETLIAVAPAAAAMVDVVLNHLLNESVRAAQEESAGLVKRKIKALFNMEQKNTKDPIPLTKEQLEQVRRLARKQAIKFGIPPEKAERMANALIGLLALA